MTTHTIAQVGIGIGLGILLVSGVSAACTPNQENPLPPCAAEDSNNCFWDADARSNGNGLDFVTIDDKVYYAEDEVIVPAAPVLKDPVTPAPKPTFIPAPSPSPTAEPVSTTPSLDGPKIDWDLGTLECGIHAKPAIDQDGYGNWWAYCEPALVD